MRFLARVLTGGIAVALIVGWASTARGARPVVVTPVSTDPYTNATSQHATEVEPDTFAFGIADRGRLPGRPLLRRRRDEHRLGDVDATAACDWSEGFLPGHHRVRRGPLRRGSATRASPTTPRTTSG